MSKAEKKSETKALTKKDESKKLVWLGGQKLLSKQDANSKEGRAQRMVVFVARALKISVFGVNILGDLPYINKIGLAQKAKEYEKDVKFKYNWVEYAKDDTAKAIVACKLVVEDAEGKETDLSDWVVGECSPSTQKMGTLKGYQNHMAQTRAKNRAIMETFGIKMHEELMKRVQELQDAGVSEQEAARIGNAVGTSYEEIQLDQKPITRSEQAKDPIKDFLQYAITRGAEKGKEKEFIEQKLGRSIDWENLTDKQIWPLKSQLMAKTAERGQTDGKAN